MVTVSTIVALLIIGVGAMPHVRATLVRDGETNILDGGTRSISRRNAEVDVLGTAGGNGYGKAASPAIVSIDPADLTVAPGSSFTVTVWVEDVEDLGGFQFDLGYTPSVVHVDGIELGAFPGSTGRTWSPLGPNIDNGAGIAEFGGFSFGSQPGAEPTGELAIISLSAQGSTGDKTQLDLGDVQIFDTEAASQTVTVEDGQVTLGDPNTPPTISGLPDQELPINGSANNAIDLWTYADDAEDNDSDLTFSIHNFPAAEAGVTIDGNRFVDINPATGWTGTTTVEIQVEDSGGMTDTDSFQVSVTGSAIYLPVAFGTRARRRRVPE
jgi:hypothetical protein